MATNDSILRRSRRRRPDRTVFWRRRAAVLFILVAVILVLAGASKWFFGSRGAAGQQGQNADEGSPDRFTILLLGADDRPGSPGRSDTMQLVFVDFEKRSVKLVSLPRDSFVEIPGHGWGKLNSAYPLGQTELARQTVERLVGIPIDHTVKINMQGFKAIVDALGGVDITIPEDMIYDDPYDDPPLHIHLKKGEQRLTGEEALQFVRFRADAQSDWGRMNRQQEFLKALAREALKPSNVMRIPQLVKAITEHVETDLSAAQIGRLGALGLETLSDQSVESGGTVTGDDLWTEEGYYLALNFKEMRAMIRAAAGLPESERALVQDEEDFQEYLAALPAGSSTPRWVAGPAEGEPVDTDGAEPGGSENAESQGTGTPDGTGPGTAAPDGTGSGSAKSGTSNPGNGAGATAPGTADPGSGAGSTGAGTADPGATHPGNSSGTANTGPSKPSSGTRGI